MKMSIVYKFVLMYRRLISPAKTRCRGIPRARVKQSETTGDLDEEEKDTGRLTLSVTGHADNGTN